MIARIYNNLLLQKRTIIILIIDIIMSMSITRSNLKFYIGSQLQTKVSCPLPHDDDYRWLELWKIKKSL
jgi:hypothetical protein